MAEAATFAALPAPAELGRYNPASRTALVVAAALFVIQAGVAVLNLSPLIERYTVSSLLDVNGEGNLVAWLSSAVLLAIATAAGLAAAADWASGKGRRLWRGWALLSALFVLLSADEAAGLHELIGEKTHRIVDIEGLPSLYEWVLVVAPLGVVVAVLLLRWLGAAVGVRSVTGRLALAALALWLAVPILEVLDPALGGPVALSVVEESLEAAGEALLLAGVIVYLGMPGRLAALAGRFAGTGRRPV